MGEPRRLRAALAVAAACALLLASAVLYLHPAAPGRQALRPLPPPVTARLFDFQVVSAKVAWACLEPLPAGSGLIYATKDGGRTWRQLTFPSSDPGDYKFSVQLIDATHGVLQLHHGLYTTADGGHRWRSVPLPRGQTAQGARFLNPSLGWYVDPTAYPGQAAQPTGMWWTSDGGASWSELWRVDAGHPLSGGVPLDGGKFVLGFRDASTGWLEVARSGAGRLLETADGGRTWSPLDLGLPAHTVYPELAQLADGAVVLLASTSSGWLALPSRDGGRTWEEARPVPVGTPPAGGERPSFIDHDHWSIAGGSVVHVTSDAGMTWRVVAASLPPGVTELHDLWLDGSGEGWATGDGGGISRRVLHTTDGGAHWSRSPVPYLRS